MLRRVASEVWKSGVFAWSGDAETVNSNVAGVRVVGTGPSLRSGTVIRVDLSNVSAPPGALRGEPTRFTTGAATRNDWPVTVSVRPSAVTTDTLRALSPSGTSEGTISLSLISFCACGLSLRFLVVVMSTIDSPAPTAAPPSRAAEVAPAAETKIVTGPAKFSACVLRIATDTFPRADFVPATTIGGSTLVTPASSTDSSG